MWFRGYVCGLRTDIHTDMIITVLRSHARGGVIKVNYGILFWLVFAVTLDHACQL